MRAASARSSCSPPTSPATGWFRSGLGARGSGAGRRRPRRRGRGRPGPGRLVAAAGGGLPRIPRRPLRPRS
jgi:hypothetical protein